MSTSSAESEHKRQRLYVVLACIFVTCLVLGDVTGGKAFAARFGIWPFTALDGPVSVGMILFPVTFLLTDVINDFYGRKGARFVTWVAAAMAALAYFALIITTALPAHPDTYFPQDYYVRIFGASAKLFAASILAFVVGQMLDIAVFQFWKRLLRGKHLWLRATGSTLISQLVDTITINVIFWSGVGMTSAWITEKIIREYAIKVVVAVLLTPIVYAIHGLVTKGLSIAPEPIEGLGLPGTDGARPGPDA